jgi:transmembrane sensor
MSVERDMDEAAAGWVLRMASAEWVEADETGLQHWLACDNRHAGALLQAQALWGALDIAHEAELDSPCNGDPVTDTAASVKLSRRLFLGGGGAAIAASIAALLYVSSDPHYSTTVGEIRRVPLADGSIATINTDSALDVAMAATQRDVRLNRGEAWFQVAKNPARPFVVAAGRVRARAVGTAFSVRRLEGGAEILVTEGIVDAWAQGAEGHRVTLRAGDSAFVADDAAIRFKQASAQTIDRQLAWRAGKIDLASTSLGDAAAEFNRYNARKIEILDPQLNSERLDGVFNLGDPSNFAIAVRDGLQVPVDLSDPAIIRIGSGLRKNI